MDRLRALLQKVPDSYEDFVSGVMSYVKIPGNESKADLISDFITGHPEAMSSDILRYVVDETGFFESIKEKNMESVA